MDIQNQRKILEKALAPLPKTRPDYEELGDLFTGTYFEEFDRLSLPQQAMQVMSQKAKWEIYNEQYQKNSGKRGGRPNKWSKEQLENLQHQVTQIMKTNEYATRKRKNDKGIMAVRILVERLLIDYKFSGRTEKAHQEEIGFITKAFKQRLDAYNKTLSGT